MGKNEITLGKFSTTSHGHCIKARLGFFYIRTYRASEIFLVGRHLLNIKPQLPLRELSASLAEVCTFKNGLTSGAFTKNIRNFTTSSAFLLSCSKPVSG